MQECGHHAALWLCADNSSSIVSLTRRSFAKSSNSSCLERGTPRRPHISIALGDILNRSASAFTPPSRSTIVDISAMAAIRSTISSNGQELPVPTIVHIRFHANDNRKEAGNRWGMAVKETDEISKVALARFLELMADMGWDEDYAVDQLYEEIGQPLESSKKMIEQWFTRGIPPGHIFNISTVFGIDAGWLAGQAHLDKAKAIRASGLYAREVSRENRQRTARGRR
jgi:hypothetical protein